MNRQTVTQNEDNSSPKGNLIKKSGKTQKQTNQKHHETGKLKRCQRIKGLAGLTVCTH